jgi:hypothetical protein
MGSLGNMHTIVSTRGHLRPLGWQIELHGLLVDILGLRSWSNGYDGGPCALWQPRPSAFGGRLPYAGACGDETQIILQRLCRKRSDCSSSCQMLQRTSTGWDPGRQLHTAD